MKRTIKAIALVLGFSVLLPGLSACSEASSEAAASGEAASAQNNPARGKSANTGAPAEKQVGVIARVGDQVITFHEINTMINSAAIVGLSMPELGSPERDTVRITLLDKLISANLLYLDAMKQGVDKSPEYQQAIASFRDAILANLYRRKHLVGEVEVTDQEVKDFYDRHIAEGTEFTDEVRAGIEATIRKDKSSIIVSDLDPAEDPVRSDDDVLAELDGVGITWGEVRSALQRAHTMQSAQQRIEAIEKIIDSRLMSQDAKQVGLEQDPGFKARFDEFSKTRLVNLHRGRLVESWNPTPEEINAFYDANKGRIIVKEVRKVQMLVVKTEDEADALKKKIEAGKTTFHKAVADHSIVEDAAKTLGQIGWVSEGSGFLSSTRKPSCWRPARSAAR